MWTPILNKMKEHSEPSGQKILQNVIDSLDSYDDAYSNSDFPALSSLFQACTQVFSELMPHITNEKLSTANSHLVQECERIAQVVANGGSLKHCANFVRHVTHPLMSAMQ